MPSGFCQRIWVLKYTCLSAMQHDQFMCCESSHLKFGVQDYLIKHGCRNVTACVRGSGIQILDFETVSWEPEGHYCSSKMFSWEPEGCYCRRLCTAIAPFWFSTEHLLTAITPFWLSTDEISCLCELHRDQSYFWRINCIKLSNLNLSLGLIPSPMHKVWWGHWLLCEAGFARVYIYA